MLLPDSSVNTALRKIVKGQEARAFKLLCSNGIVKVVLSALRSLHPQRQEDLKLPATSVKQVSMDEEFVAKRLFLFASDL